MQLILLLIFNLSMALAHQTSTTTSGYPLRWPNKSIPIQIETNTNDLNATTILSIAQQSLTQWNGASTLRLAPVSSSPHRITFSDDFSIFGSAVIGLTEVNYSRSGAISGAVIRLNDRYNFTSSQSSFGFNSVYLGDVITHELGHFLGLGHSEILNSSMFHSSFPGQSTIALDDIVGLRQKYDTGHGTITGKVQGGKGIGVMGVHVQAISRRTGETTGIISGADGIFTISGLNLDDSYYIYTSPIKNQEPLPQQFSNIQTDFCPGSYVGSFFTPCGRENEGYPQAISLTSSRSSVDIGIVTINCSLRSDEEYAYQKVRTSFNSVTIWDSTEFEKNEKAFAGYFHSSANWSQWEDLHVDLSSTPDPSGKTFHIQLVAYPFGNLLQYEMEVLKDGVQVALKTINESLVLGTFNTDLTAAISLGVQPAANNFNIRIRAKNLSDTLKNATFPSPDRFASANHMPHLLLLHLKQGSTLLYNNVQLLSDNASCLDAPFTYEVKSALATDESTPRNPGVAPTCGTIEPPRSGPGGNLFVVSLGFMLSLILGSLGKKAKKTLS